MSSHRDDSDAPDAPGVFHAGELLMQERCGVRDRIEQVGLALIHHTMSLQHRQFFAMQRLLFAGSLDEQRRPWASVLCGERGFVHALDERTLRVDALPQSGDPLAANLAAGVPLGLLGIEFATRRRNRMNGTVVETDANGFRVGVDQSFGNCPQYIQARDFTVRSESALAHPVEELGADLDDHALAIVGRADTLMIATAAAQARGRAGADGVDVSHRGGKPGFVRASRDGSGRTVLAMPDFRGNYLFNTLGNITANPRAGLLIFDFASGALLQLTGTAAIVWDGSDVDAYAGAQRLVVVAVEDARLRRGALPIAWSEPEFARQLDDTGPWR